MRYWLVSARLWLAAAILLLPTALLVLSLCAPADPVLFNRWNTVIALVPRGGLFILHTGQSPTSVLRIYDCTNTNFIITHTPEGVAFVQTLETRPRRMLPPIFVHDTYTGAPALGPARGTPPAPIVAGVVLSLWWTALFALLAATGLTWSAWRRRPAPSQCPRCEYSRTGLAANSACPECGGRP